MILKSLSKCAGVKILPLGMNVSLELRLRASASVSIDLKRIHPCHSLSSEDIRQCSE